VWGKPVISKSAAAAPLALAEYKNGKQIGQADVETEKPIIHYGPLRIASGTQILRDIKVHGPLDVESGVHIAGNVIARGDITFAADVTVDGHVFSEYDVHLGPGCRVGRHGGVKTAYAAGHMSIADNVEVEGWIVAEDGGRTL
jgi:cytoskeletal protein CcmA (bactofilin family)